MRKLHNLLFNIFSRPHYHTQKQIVFLRCICRWQLQKGYAKRFYRDADAIRRLLYTNTFHAVAHLKTGGYFVHHHKNGQDKFMFFIDCGECISLMLPNFGSTLFLPLLTI